MVVTKLWHWPLAKADQVAQAFAKLAHILQAESFARKDLAWDYLGPGLMPFNIYFLYYLYYIN